MSNHKPKTTPERSALMKRVRQRGTKPELEVRNLLTSIKAHYRLNVKKLPGSPDIANRSRKKAIFVHGCFWHGHTVCGRGRIPKENRGFWADKLRQNMERDERKISELRGLGYNILVIWGCELEDQASLTSKLKKFWFD